MTDGERHPFLAVRTAIDDAAAGRPVDVLVLRSLLIADADQSLAAAADLDAWGAVELAAHLEDRAAHARRLLRVVGPLERGDAEEADRVLDDVMTDPFGDQEDAT